MNNEAGNQNSFMTSLKKISTAAYSKDLEPKQELYLEMSGISEAGYFAGWNVNLEFFLWQAVVNGGSKEFGAKTITEAEIAHLKTLSEQSGGWWHWNDESAKTQFIPMDKWQEIYQSFSEKQSS